jgi:hypothetical protein
MPVYDDPFVRKVGGRSRFAAKAIRGIADWASRPRFNCGCTCAQRYPTRSAESNRVACRRSGPWAPVRGCRRFAGERAFGDSVRHSGSSAPGETVTVTVRAGNGIVPGRRPGSRRESGKLSAPLFRPRPGGLRHPVRHSLGGAYAISSSRLQACELEGAGCCQAQQSLNQKRRELI